MPYMSAIAHTHHMYHIYHMCHMLHMYHTPHIINIVHMYHMFYIAHMLTLKQLKINLSAAALGSLIGFILAISCICWLTRIFYRVHINEPYNA